MIGYTIYCRELLDTDTSSGSGKFFSSLGSGFTEDFETSAERSITLAQNETEALFPGLMPYSWYCCYVSANTSAGEGNSSIHVVGRTDESSQCMTLYSRC